MMIKDGKVALDISLDDYFVSEIVIARLQRDARYIVVDIKDLVERQATESWHLEDLRNWHEDLNAINRVLRYYGGEEIWAHE